MASTSLTATDVRPGRPQGFEVLRIVAAAAVVVSHSYSLLGPDGGTVIPVAPFGDFVFDLGRVGVIVFFVVSGYLVCGSWLADPRPLSFAAKRAFRLMPGLLVMLLLVTFVVVPLITSSDAYWSDPQTYLYFVRNLLVFPYTYDLPGAFEGNPSQAVNGVLWTLGVEVLAYVMLAVAGVRGWLRSPARLAVVAAVLAVVGWRLISTSVLDGALVPVALRVELVAYFFAAATIRSSRWRPDARAAAASLAVLVLLMALGASLSILMVPLGTVMVVYLGTRQWDGARAVTRLGDPSYGTYIYGFVLQQLIISAFGPLESRPLFAVVSVVASLAVGYLSWHVVERRALRYGRGLVLRSPSRTQPRTS